MESPPLATACAFRELENASAWPGAFEALRHLPYSWLLESSLAGGPLGRFSFAGADPYLVLRVSGTRIQIDVRRPARPGWNPGRSEREGDPFEVVRELLPSLPAAGLGTDLPFVGGAVGFFGYELAAHIERLHFRKPDVLLAPELLLLFVDRVLAVDHEQGRLIACGLGMGSDETQARLRAEEAARDLAARVVEAPTPEGIPARPPQESAPVRVDAFFDAARYGQAVEQVKERILAGDVYQANLTQRLDLDWSGDCWQLYRALRKANPAPFAAYLGLPEVTVVSSSPERFLRVDSDGWVESRPIKGTRPRGFTPEDDERERKALERSGKDRAENLMIVDLMRNDLGRVCEPGSVQVPDLMAIETYATVFHMVSTVRGRLRAGQDVLDAIHACFPPGSMTGAPKIAAMKLLAEIEPVRRGIYAGALGYLDVRGGADLSVVIRTILQHGSRAHVHAGGAVVADSDPHAEYRESKDKARVLLEVLGARSDG